jgi:hypothetical protein
MVPMSGWPATFLAASLLPGAALLAGQSGWKRINPVERGPQMAQRNDRDSSTPVRATRLIFEYDGDNVRLVSEQSVEVAAATINQPAAEATGTFVDARDRSDRTLARVTAPHAFTTSVEVFPEAPGQAITRTDVPQPKGAFTVVVPTPDDTDHATIVSVARVRGAATPTVSDLVSFPLRRGR